MRLFRRRPRATAARHHLVVFAMAGDAARHVDGGDGGGVDGRRGLCGGLGGAVQRRRQRLQSRARLLIASGSLAADPGKAIEGTAYSDVNAMLIIPGKSIFTAQEGQTLPIGATEKSVIAAICSCPGGPRRSAGTCGASAG